MPEFTVALLIVIGLLPISLGTKQNLEDKLTAKYSLVSEKPSEVKQPNLVFPPVKTASETFTAGKALYAIDLASGTKISAYNEKEKTEIASLTKLMTAYVILKENKLSDVITVPALNPQPGDAVAGLATGDRLEVKSALKGLLINSGSDAAQTIAIANAGSTSAFVVKMNDYATKLKLANTHYTNPVGWDEPNNYSTAEDIATLARILARNQVFREITGTKTTTIQTLGGRVLPLQSTNELLGTDGIIGLKTGYTPGAGQCFASLENKNGREIITVILGSNDRFGETKQYLDWIYRSFSW